MVKGPYRDLRNLLNVQYPLQGGSFKKRLHCSYSQLFMVYNTIHLNT